MLATTNIDRRCSWLRLHYPDGGLARHEAHIAARLMRSLHASDLVLTTWAQDGHADHGATGRVTRVAARHAGARLYEFPVWATVEATSSASCTRVVLNPEARCRKQAAIAAFRSQIRPDARSGRAPVLSAAAQRRHAGPYVEVFGYA